MGGWGLEWYRFWILDWRFWIGNPGDLRLGLAFSFDFQVFTEEGAYGRRGDRSALV
jgi:hypothetical protein